MSRRCGERLPARGQGRRRQVPGGAKRPYSPRMSYVVVPGLRTFSYAFIHSAW